MNRVILSGRMTADPEIKYFNTADGQKAMCNFTLAINRGKDKKGADKGADFVRCSAFFKTAETLELYTAKGLRIELEGRINVDQYEKDGQKRESVKVIAERVNFIDWKNDKAKPKEEAPAEDDTPTEEAVQGFIDMGDDDIPF